MSDSFLNVIKAWLPVLTVVGAAVWSVYTYVGEQKRAETARLEQARTIEDQRQRQQRDAEQARLDQVEKEAATRRIEAQKPFLELQFKTYLRTTELVGKIIHLKPNTPEYAAHRTDFSRLYWAELALVESVEVARAMVVLEGALIKYENDVTSGGLHSAAIELAHAIRDSIRSGWKGEALPK
jgi:hypothetical protein